MSRIPLFVDVKSTLFVSMGLDNPLRLVEL